MEASPARPQNMIDATDALETVSACQSMKNFLFTLIVIGLAICQIVFWMDYFGLVVRKADVSTPVTNAQTTGLPFLAATTDTISAEPAAVTAEPVKPIDQAIDEIVKTANQPHEDSGVVLENEADRIPADIVEKSEPVQTAEPQAVPEPAQTDEVLPPKKDLFSISCRFAAGVVTVCNFIVLAGAILYSLSLLICLKISLTGRLGGMNHITRAFFISLFLLVVLVPWQRVMPGVLIGSVWLPRELLCGGWAKINDSVLWQVMFYLRFCGLCLVALWLLLWAQIRSAKWARATLRRLGVVR